MPGFSQPPFFSLIFLDNTSCKFWDPSPSPIIIVVCKYLRQFLGTIFGVVTLPIYCNIESGESTWFISAKWGIPEFPEMFPGLDLVSIKGDMWDIIGVTLKFYTSVAKGLKPKVRKFWRLIPTFVEITGEKLVAGPS